MTQWTGKRYWLVGASEGLGAALAHKLSAAGAHVILSARNADRLRDLATELPGGCTILPCDVSDTASVHHAAEQIGEIDGLVMLAGVYWPQPAQEWNAGQVTAMCDVNFTGTARVLGAVVPNMVARDRGHIVITGSLAGFRGLPGATGYAASKAGVMVMAQSLYADLRKTGIKVQLANPGFIRTRLTDKNDFNMPFIMSPEIAARAIFEHMNTNAFEHSFPALFSAVFRFGRFLPGWLYYRLFA